MKKKMSENKFFRCLYSVKIEFLQDPYLTKQHQSILIKIGLLHCHVCVPTIEGTVMYSHYITTNI